MNAPLPARTSLAAGGSYRGFDVLAVADVPEYASIGVHLRHRSTGFEVFHLLNGDAENLFAFSFRTSDASSRGAPHILEHSVLCGSRRYPLKDPFIRMVNQSVKTYLNAVTYPDATVYPASSQVEADYFNLLSVYGDAVFFPRLERWAFRQEAHRLECDGAGRLSIQGVVYNEMKGVYSSFESVAADAAVRSLLPGTVYAGDSGGDPLEIPLLSYGDFKAFHAARYHPGNCLLFLYGNIPTETQLDFAEERFLKDFAGTPPAAPVPNGDVAPFSRPVALEIPAPAGSESGCTVLVNWLLCKTADAVSHMEAVFLTEVLLGHDASPLTRALLDSGLGEDVAPACGIEADVKYTLLSAGLRGVKRQDAPLVERCIRDALEAVAAGGADSRDVAGAVMGVDFSNREIRRANGPYSLVLGRRVLRSWAHGGSPWDCLSPRATFAEVKRRLSAESGYIPRLIRTLLLDNPHRSLVTAYPDAAYGAGRERAEQELASRLAAGTTPDAIRAEQAELTRFQQSSDDEKAAASLPHLSPKDLPAGIDRIETTAFLADKGVPVFRNREHTNGISYVVAGFPVDALPPEDFPLLPLFADALTNCGFGGKDWAECGAEIAATAGGFGASLFASSLPEPVPPDAFMLPETAMRPLLGRSWLFVHVKMLNEKTGEALGLLADCLASARFSDLKRLTDLTLEARNDTRASVIPAGNEYAASRAACLFSVPKAIDEIWHGAAQLFTLDRLAAGDMGGTAAAFDRLRETLRASGAVLHITADDEGLALCEKSLAGFISRCGLAAPAGDFASAPGGATRNRDAFFRLCALPWKQDSGGDFGTELCLAPSSQVGFACRSLAASAYGTAESVHEAVFAHWFSNTLLWEQIRTIGGAYGAFALPDAIEGVFSLATYRDPKPFRSLGAFAECLKKAVAFPFDRETAERAITGAYSREVQPRSPSSRGFQGFIRALYGLTERAREERIARILSVREEDLRNAARRLWERCGERCAQAVLAGAADAGAARVAELPL
jgi:Zn-dependent M16 (insulinase) family peptidase